MTIPLLRPEKSSHGVIEALAGLNRGNAKAVSHAAECITFNQSVIIIRIGGFHKVIGHAQMYRRDAGRVDAEHINDFTLDVVCVSDEMACAIDTTLKFSFELAYPVERVGLWKPEYR